jgi:hypothetical protein
MKASTHQAFGLTFGLTVLITVPWAVFAVNNLEQALIFLGSVWLGSLLPDLDTPRSKLGRKLWFLSVPLFILVGTLMNQSGITTRLFRVAQTLVAHWRGGLCHVNVVASLVFSGSSGAALADVAGLPADAVTSGVFYAGYADFFDGDEATFDTHPMTEDLDREGTASGRQTLDGTQYYHRRQTYEPVPLGYVVGPPASCPSGCDAPNWVVDQDAWQEAGGLSLGRTFVRPGPEGGDGWDGVSVGELPLGDGVVRVIGGLLPEPTQENFHPYGLSSYALTYTGYQLFENATTWTNPTRLR